MTEGDRRGYRFAGLGDPVLPREVAPYALALAIPENRRPLVLAPSSGDGWFGGCAVIALDPIEMRSGQTVQQAGTALEAAFHAEKPVLVAVLAAYDGRCVVGRYEGALVRTASGWCEWGAVASGSFGAFGMESPERLYPSVAAGNPLLVDSAWDLSGVEFRGAVELARERIASGDVYVLNMTARLQGGLAAVSPADAFAALRTRAEGEMSAYWAGLPGASAWVASVSPERFVRVREGDAGARVAEVSPIKGTRPRGATPDADAALAQELLNDPKERAEHVMIVDLERNDLGVVCAPGTVHVAPLYEVKQTPYCHQLVSTVRGTLRPEAGIGELFSALFPCGSVTGAPKRAAMSIIRELEGSSRGAYCGSLLVALPGELDSSVLIRTLEGDAQNPSAARWGAGCGITHDSDSAAEYLEMLLKTSPVMGDGAPDQALRETMRVARGRVPLLDRHLARLASGGTGASVLASVREAVCVQLRRLDPTLPYARLGVTVTPDGAVAAGTTMDPSSLDVPGGPRIAVIPVTSLPALPPGAAKPASRRYWDRAHRAARAKGADQAVLVDHEGRLIDGSTASVWLVVGGELLTPFASPAVAGVARAMVFDIASALGLAAREAVLTIQDLETAEEVFLSNAVGLIVSVRDRGGLVSAQLESAVRELFG